MKQTTAEQIAQAAPKSRGFWGEAWLRFRRRKLSMTALCYRGVPGPGGPASRRPSPARSLSLRSTREASTFPRWVTSTTSWENPIFIKDRFRKIYPENLKKKDPESWAIWPLVYQDPYRRIRENEWPGQPENPSGDQGRPNRYNWFGTDQRGVDVFAQLVHGTRVALLVGFVSMGIAATIGITVGALAGYFGGWVDMLLSRTDRSRDVHSRRWC